MTVFLIVIAVLVGLAVALLGLAHYWANTPHGRIKPTFALVFGLAKLLNPKGTKRGLGAAEMDTPEQTEKMRTEFLKNMAPLAKPVAFAGTIEDRSLSGAPGGELPVRIYQPDARDDGGPLPLVLYFHGGGFVVGSPVSADAAMRTLAMSTPAVVVSVDYRMAPGATSTRRRWARAKVGWSSPGIAQGATSARWCPTGITRQDKIGSGSRC